MNAFTRLKLKFMFDGTGDKIKTLLTDLIQFAINIWIVQLIWNSLLLDLFHAPEIGYWQTLQLLVLVRLIKKEK